jgi:hypothetical protein
MTGPLKCQGINIPAEEPRFKSMGTKPEEDENGKIEKEDVFEIQMEEDVGETTETKIEIPSETIDGRVISEGQEGVLQGVVEGMVDGAAIGARERACEGFAGGAYEGAAELDVTGEVTADITGDITMGPGEDELTAT